MYQEVKRYLSKLIYQLETGQLSPYEQDRMKENVLLLVEIGLVSTREYSEWAKILNGIMVKPVSYITDNTRVINSLTRIGIMSCGQLRKLMIQPVDGRTLFDIRNLGERGLLEIVQAALDKQIVERKELGRNYERKRDRKQWEMILSKITE